MTFVLKFSGSSPSARAQIATSMAYLLAGLNVADPFNNDSRVER
eukprot:CAMPEP_0198273436 /NCGR_PEP_ID=MMETSP1447-20131203/56876_1 /TAXON_ID=420782 /ORGANISM="Chaetoceros dichaeta, Strain CCMP1751" /LENGTH=43 /DNA_ID= /DNA_START= /DNA_END= /DNA_ORIENTATION=